MTRKLAVVTILILALAVAACATARMSGQVGAGEPPPASAPASTDASASYDFSHPDRSCKVDADCAVKDVGNCCGKHPECVNKDAPTDPAKVKAQCAAEHRAGMCNVRAIGGCSCVQGKCSDLNPIGIQR
jgi:hypothetical protein